MTALLRNAAAVVVRELRSTGGDVHDETLVQLEEALAGPQDPTRYDEMDPRVRARLRDEENLCGRCAHSAVCVVAKLQSAELELVVSRCLQYVNVDMDAPFDEEDA